MDQTFSLAVHGGAGTVSAASMTPEAEAGYRAGLRAALHAGHAVLSQGGTALDAVTAAVMALEDDPLFNAGRGAVLTSAGRHEMDAAIMDGRRRRAGAVAGVCGPRNPVAAARLVMERSEHVFLVGEGALEFCRAQGLVLADADYFRTERRWQALQSELARRAAGGAGPDAATRPGSFAVIPPVEVAAARSPRESRATAPTVPCRVGDSPVLGAGTWAENGACAVSATGHGEFFIRYGVAHEIAARVRLAGQSLAQAAGAAIAELGTAGGEGGVVAVDASGAVAMPFNSEGMYRGMIGPDGAARTEIF